MLLTIMLGPVLIASVISMEPNTKEKLASYATIWMS
jgi:hypothetical protein